MQSLPTLLGVGKILHQHLGEALQENVVLRPFTRLGVGGVADYLIEANSSAELTLAVATAIFAEVPYTVIGEGSSVLVSDTGFPGLLIINRSKELGILASQGVVIAGSGLPLFELLSTTAAQGLAGLEPLAGRVGTVGGAAYSGGEMGTFRFLDFAREATVVRAKRPLFRRSNPLAMVEIITLARNKIAPGVGTTLRELREKPKSIMLSLRLQLTHRRVESIMQSMSRQLELREGEAVTAQPQLAPVFTLDQSKERLGELWRVAHCFGLCVNDAATDQQIPNIILNRGQATATDVRRLIDLCKQQVATATGQLLSEEVEYVGRW